MFKYLDRVKVIKGFYAGCEGIAVEYKYSHREHFSKYDVEITKNNKNISRRKTVEIREEYLEIIKGDKNV